MSKTKQKLSVEAPPKAKELSGGSSFLSIPQISRTGSHESFATDISLLSLSSFASESCNARHRHSFDKEDEDSENGEIIKHREDIFEKMLESGNFPEPVKSDRNLKKLGGTAKNKCRRPAIEIKVSESEQELMTKSNKTGDARQHTKLYKCFSTTDVTTIHEIEGVITVEILK